MKKAVRKKNNKNEVCSAGRRKYKLLLIKTHRTARGVLVRTYISGFRGI